MASEGVRLGVARVSHATAKALLLTFDDLDGEKHWVPKSAIHDDSEVYKDDSEPGELVVHEWFAHQQEWL
jgi:hypothetical protein